MKQIVIFLILLELNYSCMNNSNDKKMTASSISTQDKEFIDSYEIQIADYSLTYADGDTLYLWGKYELNDTIILFDFSRKKILKAKTLEYKVSPLGAYDQIVMTRISLKIKKDNNVMSRAVALLNNKKSINILNIRKINDLTIEKEVDSVIRTLNVLDLYKDFDGADSSCFSSGKPSIEEVKTNNFTFLIASYKKSQNENSIEPRFVVLPNNKVFSLSGPCSSDDYGVYSINGVIYIQSVSWCCRCGLSYTTVKKVNENEVQLIYENSDFSM